MENTSNKELFFQNIKRTKGGLLRTEGHEENLGDNVNILYLDCDGDYKTVCVCWSPPNSRLKGVNCVVGKL